MKRLFLRFVREDEAQDLIEYGLLTAFVAMVVIASVTTFGSNLNTWWSGLAEYIGGWPPAP